MQNEIKLRDESKVKTKGVHTISVCDARSDEAQILQDELENVRLQREMLIKCGEYTESRAKMLWDKYNYFLKKLHSKFLVRQICLENLTVTVGRNVLAQRLAGINTYTGNVTHTALGSSSTAPVVGNTQLGTEVYRKALSSGTASAAVSYIETFFTATETSGTYQEYGNFIDGSGSANSGQLVNRFTTTTVKSSLETLNVQSVITISDA